jgi:isoleucyl-tRNA synthetase
VEYPRIGKSSTIRSVFIVAADLIPKVSEELGQNPKLLGTFDGQALNGCFYWSPMYNDLALPLLPGSHVTNTMGTGLVHSSFAHGFDDYRVQSIIFISKSHLSETQFRWLFQTAKK